MFSVQQKIILLRHLAPPFSRESLLSFIGWLDRECLASENHGSAYYQVLARATVALGYVLLEVNGNLPTILTTLKSAENYALNPSSDTWDHFSECATASYPFGPGDGCFSVKELDADSSCKPGSGCKSGAGSFASLGLNESKVMESISVELVPWIMESDDPIIARKKS